MGDRMDSKRTGGIICSLRLSGPGYYGLFPRFFRRKRHSAGSKPHAALRKCAARDRRILVMKRFGKQALWLT